jgi:hypothetical protein
MKISQIVSEGAEIYTCYKFGVAIGYTLMGFFL